jgi:hypothetical protein
VRYFTRVIPVDPCLNAFKVVDNNKFGLPPWPKLMEYRVIVTSCMDANILVEAQCTNTHLMSLEREVTRGLYPRRKIKTAIEPHWTHLLIDEASANGVHVCVSSK